ncbi:MAG: hypothetical protein J6S57_02655 [Alphaproteobacteria bacterium]|nr:hypothetical protein [Alphaproteobacteria bacterium]
MKEDLLAIQIFLVFFCTATLWSAVYALGTRRKIVFTVKEKGTLTHGYTSDGHGTTYTNFMVYTTDGRALKNVNSFWFWKWRSTELQAKLQKGKRYTAVVYGWRIGGLNVYPNIVSAKLLRYDSSKKKVSKKMVKKTVKKRKSSKR